MQDVNLSRVKRSRSRLRCSEAVKQENDGQNFLTLVAAVTTPSIGATNPWV